MKLKTLEEVYEDASTPHHGLEAYNRLLKQEAIKDIKEIQNLENSPLDKTWEKITGYKMVYSLAGKQAVINYIKWKFNISEEDLK